jgi:antitoxin component YwqK of YwqJK toxin-antitoxin module
VLHGSYVSVYPDWAVVAVGQVVHGLRSGWWVFYDAKGTLVGETEFREGNFDGRRVFYRPDGTVKSEERYVQGRLIESTAVAAPVVRKAAAR